MSRIVARKHDEENKTELLRGKMQAFRNLYCFLSQVIPYQDSDLERLYVFLRHLAAILPRRGGGPTYLFNDEVRLEYCRLQKVAEGSIALGDVEAAVGDDGLRQVVAVNPVDRFALLFDNLLKQLFLERLDQNEETFVRYMNDKRFQETVSSWMASESYRRRLAESAAGSRACVA